MEKLIQEKPNDATYSDNNIKRIREITIERVTYRAVIY